MKSAGEISRRASVTVKQLRSKSIGVQRKILDLTLTKVKKVRAEFGELSLRNWKGGELDISMEVNAARDKLAFAVTYLDEASSHLEALEKMAVRKGK